MFGVKNKHQIEQMRFLSGVAFILAQHTQEIFGNGKVFARNVQIQRFAVKIVALDGIGVGDNDRKTPNQLNGLAHNVFN